MAGKCEHGLTTRECFVCASPKYGAPQKLADAAPGRPSLDRLQAACIDWDGSEMVDGEPPMECLTVGDVRDALREFRRIEQEAAFYRRRCEALQQWQSRMRDPERTVVCDILANGFTLDPPIPFDRYKVKG